MNKRWFLAGLYVAVIIAIIVIADGTTTHRWLNFVRVLPYGDKVAHFLLMGGLSFVINWALRCRRFTLGRWRVLLGSTVVLLLVTAEEISQLFNRYRTFDLTDLACDFAGIFLGGYLATRYTQRNKES